MTKFYDGKKVIEISMIDNNNGASFEADFFEIGGLPFDDEKGYVVKDVDYLVDYAKSYAAGKNPDFDNFGDDTPACKVIIRQMGGSLCTDEDKP